MEGVGAFARACLKVIPRGAHEHALKMGRPFFSGKRWIDEAGETAHIGARYLAGFVPLA